MVKVIVFDEDNQRAVALCVALISTVPPSRRVTRLPEIVAIAGFSD
jgi:hypothetical protein